MSKRVSMHRLREFVEVTRFNAMESCEQAHALVRHDTTQYAAIKARAETLREQAYSLESILDGEAV